MRLVNGQTFCVLVVYRPMHSSGDAETDFKSIWPRLLGRSAGPGLPTPIYDLRTQVGYPGKQSGSPSADRLNYLWLYTLETGQHFIPVVVLTTGRDILDSQQSVIKRFVEGVRQGPIKAQAAKTTINLADLAGEWRHGEGSVTDYANRSTGAFVTSSTVFFGETFVIAADGRYAYRFGGRSNNKTIREQSTDVLEMGGEFLVFRDNPGPQVRRYRFISYQPAIGGSTVLTQRLERQTKQQVIALGRLGWSLRRIQKTTGVRRETAAAYLREAGGTLGLSENLTGKLWLKRELSSGPRTKELQVSAEM